MRVNQDIDQPFLIGPEDGRQIGALGMVHKVGADRFDGALLIMEGVLRPGQLIPPHTHSREDECTYVLSGELTFEVGGEIVQVQAGSYVVKPRGLPHAFWNSSSELARVTEVHTPGSFDRYYDELAEVFTSRELDDDRRRQAEDALHAQYGLTFHRERVPEIMTRYNVRP